MTYLITSYQQLSNFLSAVGLGFLTGIVYVFMFFFRSLFGNGKIAYIIQDVMFCLISAFLSFCFFLVYTEGELRPELIFAIAVGFFIFVLTVGKYISAPLRKLSCVIRKISDMILLPFRIVERYFKKIIGFIKEKLGLLFSEISFKCKNFKKIFKREKKKSKKIKNSLENNEEKQYNY